MTLHIPDYTRKFSWAEQHLVKLEGLITEFADHHPYTVRQSIEGKQAQKRWTFAFTEQPDHRLPLTAGDVLYNLRAGLDHLACALVPAADRSHVMFPILTEPVWDIPFEDGESGQRTTNRQRWETITRHMRPDAVAILKRLQPLDSRVGPSGVPALRAHVLVVLNRLSNRDRHRSLPVHSPVSGAISMSRLSSPTVQFTRNRPISTP